MSVVVAGVADQAPVMPAAQAEQQKPDENAEPQNEGPTPKAKAKARVKAKAKAKCEATGGSKQKKKAKKELTGEQEAEAKSKEILCNLQRSQQIMEKLAGFGDAIPSEWSWAKGFLTEYQGFLTRFKGVLRGDDGGDDLTDFVDELKLNVISKAGLKSLKKTHGDRYEQLLALFVDRCHTIAAQKLGQKRKPIGFCLFVFFGGRVVFYRSDGGITEDECNGYESAHDGSGYELYSTAQEEIS